jgi:Pro-kumamolisin, activation domain
MQAYYFARFVMVRLRSSGCLVYVILVLALFASGCSATGVLGGAKAERTTSASGEPLVRLQHDRPEGIDLSKEHDAPPDKVIPLEVEFAMRNKQQFDELMHEIADPQSPNYRRWLTPEEMHARFGETESQFNEVLRWLQGQGFTITDKSYGTNADYIRFKGTIGQIEKAFDVQLVLPEYDQYAAKNDPAVPAKFDGVISRIVGLEEVGPLY